MLELLLVIAPSAPNHYSLWIYLNLKSYNSDQFY
jgi:hypothetical protein